MAITRTTLNASVSNTNASSYALPSTTPEATKPLLLTVAVVETLFGGTPPSPTLSGTGGYSGVTWTKVVDVTTTGGTQGRLTMWVGTGATNAAGVITIDYGGNTQSGTCRQLDQFTGANNTTPFVQAKSNFDTGTTPTVTLDAAPNANNAVIFAAGHALGTSTAGAGFTEYADLQGDVDLFVQEALSNAPQTGDCTISGSGVWAAGMVEIAQTPPAALVGQWGMVQF